QDEAWGRPLGEVAFGPETLHDLRSVTKSIVGLLYGIALDRGKVPAPDQPLMAQFPEYPDLAADPARRDLTIAHALTMTLGTEWDETLP
ncbi:serine hydrolase, partial [Acinetobacter baumannii]